MSKENGDKRSVSTDALETLGMIHFREEKRDAIHLAVDAVEAGEMLYPAQDIKLQDGKAVKANDADDGIGIVDPFLKNRVLPGQKFWLVIYPRKITSLRHVWAHPDLPDELMVNAKEDLKTLQENASRSYLIEVASEFGITYNELMSYAKDYIENEEYAVQGGRWEGMGIDREEFWKHYDIVTGTTTPEDRRWNFFSCSC